MKNTLKPLLILVLVFSCAACTNIREPTYSEPEEPSQAAVVSEQTADDKIDYGSFTEEQLYQTIISELGAQRGDLEKAGDNYLDLALETEDLAIIQRAIQFASLNSDLNALMQLALLWSDVEPSNIQPHLMLSFQFLENGNYEQALSHMARVLDLGGDMDFTALSARTSRLETEERELLIIGMRQLTREFGNQESIHIALVQLLAQNRQLQEALTEIQLLTQTQELSPNIVMLHGQILQNMEDTSKAMQVLKSGIRKFKEDKSLRLTLARLLIQNDELVDARQQFQIIVDQNLEDWESLYSLALLDMELEKFDTAIPILEKLISVDEHYDESQYYLGLIYERRKALEKSIEHYRQVRIGTNNYLAAQQQATFHSIGLGKLDEAHSWLVRQSAGQPRLEILFTTIESSLLIQTKHFNEAKELLDSALNRFPNEAELLFARVLWYDSQGDIAGSEKDLRQIIRMQPEDSRALNHLGYMLADQTRRFEEALELTERAISISPDDPAIIDSLAWAQYKLGHYEEALLNLRRAYQVFPDHEVASHLGEVLWILGRHEEATSVWENALEINPDSELIKEVIERFRPYE